MSPDGTAPTASLEDRLRRALAAAEDEEARYHLRQALQLCVESADGTEPAEQLIG